jgi:general secretion pathway protein G
MKTFPCSSSVSRRSSLAGFTLLELLTVIAIIGVLAAILFPVVGFARAKARNAQCVGNLRQIGLGVQMYVADHKGWLPCNVSDPSNLWRHQVETYSNSRSR